MVSNKIDYSKIYNTMYNELVKYAELYTKDYDDAEDAVQCSILSMLESGADILNVKWYLMRSIKNTCLNDLNSCRMRLSDRYNQALLDNIPDEPVFERSKERYHKLRSIIAAMPKKRRETVIMSKFMGMSHADISSRMNISKKTVERYITSAYKNIRDNYKII